MKPTPVDESASPVPTGQQSRPLTESAMADSSALAGMMEKFQSMSPSMAERNTAETEQAQQQTRLAKARFELSPSLRRAERRMQAKEREKQISAMRAAGDWSDPGKANDDAARSARFSAASERMAAQRNAADANRQAAQQTRAARSLSYQQLKQPAAAPSGMNKPQVTQAAVGYVDPNGQFASRIANIVTSKYGTGVGGAPVAGAGGSGRTIGNEYYGNSREALLAGANKIAQSRAPQPAPRMTAQSAVQPKKNPLMPN